MKNPPIPALKEEGLARYLLSLSLYIQDSLSRCLKFGESVESFMLSSPNGSVFKVTVDDDGVLTTEVLVDRS